MKVSLKSLGGPWDDGYALDKHKISSTYIGDNPQGYPQFDTLRTEAGEAVFRLKYRNDWSQAASLATAVSEHIVPLLPAIGLIVPMPPSQVRQKQPVVEVAEELAKLMNLTSFNNVIVKSPSATGKKLKDMNTKAEKVAELDGRFSIHDAISGTGPWNALLLDDLFDTGASLEAATSALRTYAKISGIYVAALTWK